MQNQPENEEQKKKPEDQTQNNDLAKEIPTVTPDNLDPLPDEKGEDK